MNKYIFWSALMCAIFFNTLYIHSSEFVVIGKTIFNEANTVLKEKGYKITEVKPLDMDWNGFVLIVYE